jgi:hypothetical protein
MATKAAKKTVPPGMQIGQVLAMLMAAQAQGAKYVQMCARMGTGDGAQTGIDWISPAPIDSVVYIGALQPMEAWPVMDNRALESLDW